MRKDGTRFLANVITTPPYDDKGTLKGYSRIARDVSRRQEEQHLRRRRYSTSCAMRSSSAARTTRSPAGTRGAERLYGWSSDCHRPRDHDLLKISLPKPLPEIRAERETKGTRDGNLVHMRRDGKEIVVASRPVVQRDKSATRVGILDISRTRDGRQGNQRYGTDAGIAASSEPTCPRLHKN